MGSPRWFLDAPSHLYMRSCPSVDPSVRPSVRPSVGPALFSKVKITHTRRILCRVSGLVLVFLLGGIWRGVSDNSHVLPLTVTKSKDLRMISPSRPVSFCRHVATRRIAGHHSRCVICCERVGCSRWRQRQYIQLNKLKPGWWKESYAMNWVVRI